MQSFEYTAPRTMEDAILLLREGGEDARVLAGGTDIIVQVREGRRKLKLLVDVKAIPELNELDFSPDDGLMIGAALPCYRVCADPNVMRHYPGLVDAAGIVGGAQIQGRATIGGNLCNGSPAADTIPALIALQATCLITGPDGKREAPVETFCTGPGRTVLEEGELLIGLRLPPPAPRSGAHYLRFIPRNEMDIAVVGAGAAIVLEADGRTCASARIGLGAVGPTPLFAAEACAALVGKEMTDGAIEQASALARDAATPITDMRGSAGQRKHLTAVLTRRALEGAVGRARENV